MKFLNCLLAGATLALASPSIAADPACDRQCLIDLSDEYVAALVAHDPKAVRSMGIYETSKLAERLLDEGVPGIHFYTLNRSKATREVWANLALGARV